jgi:hypothetical protein
MWLRGSGHDKNCLPMLWQLIVYYSLLTFRLKYDGP